jgi:hypothetical protein
MKHLAILAILAAGTSVSWAGGATSLYSDLNIEKCEALQLFNGDNEAEGGEWECKGIKGYNVMYWEGDLRGNMAFGPLARSQCSSAQSFGAFNGPGARIEWRMEKGKPFATILRWSTDNGSGEPGAKQNWLVVTKLNGGDACRTALIDTKYPNANAVARAKADGKARTFNCERDMPEVVSLQPRKANEIISGVPCPGGPYREE